MKLGPYELLSEIGRGAAGVVFRARGPTGQDVAIKVVRVDRRDALARFERERRLLSELGESEGFVPLLDAGEAPQGAFLVMPFVGGGTLRDRFARGLLGVDDAVSLARALAAAAGRAHERGIVHRDLKPENVLYTDDGHPLIADLGLAKHFLKDAPGGTLSVSFSREGEIRGTAGYMGPEQMSDARSAGAPTDVFAIGAILYECLAGRQAFLGENVVALLTRVANQPATPIRELRPETPAWLARVVDRSLAKNPGSRYQDGAALARALSEQGRGANGRALGIAAAVSLALVLASGLLLAFSGEREGAKVVTNQAPTSGDRAKPIDPGLRGTSLEPLQDGVSPDDDTRQFDARAQREAALALEKKGSHEDALAAWFRVLDSTSAGNDGRREAMQHVRSLAGSGQVHDDVVDGDRAGDLAR
ncbi:serine/threonine protein kinase, partial [bacterium]|nr:serine/threonine protein kinase [bacterium]